MRLVPEDATPFQGCDRRAWFPIRTSHAINQSIEIDRRIINASPRRHGMAQPLLATSITGREAAGARRRICSMGEKGGERGGGQVHANRLG